MDTYIQFDLHQWQESYLNDPTNIPTPEVSNDLLDDALIDHRQIDIAANEALDLLSSALTDSPESVLRISLFHTVIRLLQLVPRLSLKCTERLVDLISGAAITVAADSETFITDASDTENLLRAGSNLLSESDKMRQLRKSLLEAFAFLLQWSMSTIETLNAANCVQSARSAPRSRTRSPQSFNKKTALTNCHVTALNAINAILRLSLSRLFLTTSERDSLISLLTRPVYTILENESNIKLNNLRMHAYRVICVAIKRHGHASASQTSIIQALSYFEHLSEPMAEFLHILAEQYDYPQITLDILREVSNKKFNSNDVKGPKSVSTFIIKLSELQPQLVIKQMTMLAKLLDDESYTLRCAMIEICGNLIMHLSREVQDECRNEQRLGQINVFFDVLEERFLDVNPYCRSRVVQVYIRLCELDAKFPNRRQTASELAARSLRDKSSHVRRNCIKLLNRLVATHPFSAMHGAQLTRSEWDKRLHAVQEELTRLVPVKPPGEELVDRANSDDSEIFENASQAGEVSSLLDAGTTQLRHCETKSPKVNELPNDTAECNTGKSASKSLVENAPDGSAELIEKLKLTQRYYMEALNFIDVLHRGSKLIMQLLRSKNKSEVIEAIEYFEVIDAFKVETARPAIKRILNLIWSKDNNDSTGRSVRNQVIDTYNRLFFEAPSTFSPDEKANYIARNMISLTFDTSPTEIISLEQLLCTMIKSGMVNDIVVKKLWNVYGVTTKEISKRQRRGAIMVLSMLALARDDIVRRELDCCLRIGFGYHGYRDLYLARYTCVALQRLVVNEQRLPDDHPVVRGLVSFLLNSIDRDGTVANNDSSNVDETEDSPIEGSTKKTKKNFKSVPPQQWFGFAEKAIEAIYAVAQFPEMICSSVLIHSIRITFDKSEDMERNMSLSSEADVSLTSRESDGLTERGGHKGGKQFYDTKSVRLAKLFFLGGHIAICQIAHLERIECDFKKKISNKVMQNLVSNSTSNLNVNHEDQELDMVSGTTEDEIVEVLAATRERGLLFHNKSVLGFIARLAVVFLMQNWKNLYENLALKSQAAICLGKMMCVSVKFCQENIILLKSLLLRDEMPETLKLRGQGELDDGDEDWIKQEKASLRCGLVVALGDIIGCFGHMIGDEMEYSIPKSRMNRQTDKQTLKQLSLTNVLSRVLLFDSSSRVRCTCLRILTRLILANRIKLRGDGILPSLARCIVNEKEMEHNSKDVGEDDINIEDKDEDGDVEGGDEPVHSDDDKNLDDKLTMKSEETITAKIPVYNAQLASLTRTFFAELTTKDSSLIYNHFFDVFGYICSDVSISEATAKAIIRFLVTFIDKKDISNGGNEELIRGKVKTSQNFGKPTNGSGSGDVEVMGGGDGVSNSNQVGNKQTRQLISRFLLRLANCSDRRHETLILATLNLLPLRDEDIKAKAKAMKQVYGEATPVRDQ